MATDSKIEWTHHTGNLWWGCTKVHAGCDNCYAETLAKRHGNDVWGNDKARKVTKSVWADFLKWQALAADAGEMHRVFVGSMMDIFEKPMPIQDWKGNLLPGDTGQIRDRFFSEIVPNCPNLMFLLLTKRPGNINKYTPIEWKTNPPKNVMFGTSPVDQKTADEMIPKLAVVSGLRFLSVEPQLGEVDLMKPIRFKGPRGAVARGAADDGRLVDYVDWVIQGGESGHHKRPFNLSWALAMKHDCREANTPYFFKQIDKVQPIPEPLQIRQFP
jgi:protein gp37